MNLAEFNRETALSKVRLADKLKKMEAETPNSEAFKNAMEALTGGEPIASEDLVGMSEKEQKRLTAYQTALARKEANQLSKEKTVQEKTEAEKKSRIVGLERVPDTGFDPADKKVASEMTAAKRELDIVINDIIESVNKNGIAWFGKEKGKQGVLASRLASSMRRFAGTGAALTAPEIPYLKELFFKAAGTEDLTTVIKEQLFSGGALNRMKELRNVVDKNYGDSLLAYNYYLPKANGDNSRFYSPNIYKDETYSFLKQEKAKPSTKTETRMYNGFEYEKSPSGEWVKVK